MTSPSAEGGLAEARTCIDGTYYDYYLGSSYYCLSNHPAVKSAAVDAINQYGLKEGTSVYRYGANASIQELEKQTRNFFHAEGALIYASGYLGSTILLQGLESQFDIIFIDEETHYSSRNAARTTGREVVSFLHHNTEDLDRKLTRYNAKYSRPLIVCDGVDPVIGRISPVNEYLSLIQKIDGAKIYIDDAHATGVLGEHGRGTPEHFNIDDPRIYVSGTMSKALGVQGGVIAGTAELIRKLNRTETIIGATDLPIPLVAAAAKSLEILSNDPSMRTSLWENALYTKRSFAKLGFNVGETVFPIVGITSENGVDLAALHQLYKQNGILTNLFTDGCYCSVPKGGCIKISIFSTHTKEQLDKLLTVTETFTKKVRS